MKKVLFSLLLFVSIKSFSQGLPNSPTSTLKGYVPALTGVSGQFFNYLGQWSTPTSGNPTLFNALLYGLVNDAYFARHASINSGSDTITCLSCNFTTTTPAIAGQWFRIDSASGGIGLDTTIRLIVDAHHLRLNKAATTTVLIKNIVWGTDNTAAFINVLDTIFVHGGGELFMPQGGYLIAGSLVSPSTINAQIPLPVANINDTTFNLRTGISIIGVSNANLSVSAYANDTINAHQGTWIESIVDAPDIAPNSGGPAPAVFGTVSNSGTTNYNYFFWENLSLYVPANVGSGGPKIGGINCNGCAVSQGVDMVIANDGSLGASDQPIHEVCGFITNRIGSEVTTYLHNVWISGFKYGVASADHAVFNNVQLFGDYYGVVAIQSAYPITFVHVGTQECNTDVYAPATQILGNITPGAARIIGSWQIETYTSPPAGSATWYLHNLEVSDSSNNLRADLTYFSNRNDLFTKYGATGINFIATNLGQFGNFPTPTTRTFPLGDSLTIANTIDFNYTNASGTPFGLIKSTMKNVDQVEQVWDNEGRYYGAANANSGRNIYWYDINGSKYLGGVDAVGQWWLGASNSNFGLRVSNAASGRSAAILASGDVTFGDTITTSPFRWDAANKRLDIGGGTPGSLDLNIVRNITGVNVGAYAQNTNAGGFTAFRAVNDASTINQFGIYGSAATAYGAIHAGFANSYTTAPNSVIMIDNGSPELDVALGSGGVAAQYKFLPTTFAPTTTVTYDLGTSSLAWRDVYISHTVGESTIGVSSGLGTNVSSMTPSGNDEDFSLTITVSVGGATGTIGNIAFGRTWGAIPKCVISPANSTAVSMVTGGAIGMNATSTTNITVVGTILAGTSGVYNCHCGQ